MDRYIYQSHESVMGNYMDAYPQQFDALHRFEHVQHFFQLTKITDTAGAAEVLPPWAAAFSFLDKFFLQMDMGGS